MILKMDLQSPILNFLIKETINSLVAELDLNNDDLLFFGAGKCPLLI